MAIRVYKPTTAGRRNASVSDFSELTRSTPEKSLVRKKSKTGGRNSYGRITSRHRGGGHKRQYRLIDFKRWDKDGVPAKVAEIEYDPNRSARIALLHFADGEKRYIIAPKGIKQGDVIETGAQADIKPGNKPAAEEHPDRYRGSSPSSSARWAALRSLVPLVLPFSSSPRMAPTLSCVCRPAKSATSTRAAALPSARSATRTTPTFSSARLAAPAGSAAVRSPVVSP